MSINTAMTLKEIALSQSASAQVLESYHLDYCCGGEQTLAQACRRANLDLDEVVAALAQAQGKPQPDPSEHASTLTNQAGFILDRHHVFTRSKLPRVGTLLARIIERHGSDHSELKAVGECFVELQVLLDPHMIREERILFAHIKALDKNSRAEVLLPPDFIGVIEDQIRQSEEEHQVFVDLMKKIRELTSDFTPPVGAVSTYGATYKALEGLETNLMHHIHLENDVLFPRVLRLIGMP
jgi:regulator of cell morphogenesis and NO signaling